MEVDVPTKQRPKGPSRAVKQSRWGEHASAAPHAADEKLGVYDCGARPWAPRDPHNGGQLGTANGLATNDPGDSERRVTLLR